MESFKTAAELEQQYAVSERVLLAYARRGNLSMFRSAGGELLFSEQGVMRLFKRRSSDAQPALGVLGQSRVG